MGGKALKSVSTRRYTTEELNKVILAIVPVLRKLLGCRVDAVVPYFSKPDHGDLDILIEIDSDVENDQNQKFEKITQQISYDEVHYNNSVVSINLSDLQVDFMFIPKQNYDLCFHFFAYNDLGGFMGKIACSMGLRFGQDGLFCDLYTFNREVKLGSVTISRDPKEIIEFLGFDYYTFVRGFCFKEDIFEYITSSRYFRKATFDGSELNCSQRSRDMGRPMYQDLLKYLVDKPDKINERPQFSNTIEQVEYWFDIDISHERYLLAVKFNDQQQAKKKFNGKLIMERYSISEMQLKNMINYFKESVKSMYPAEQTFVDWVNQVDERAMWDLFERLNNITNGTNSNLESKRNQGLDGC